MIELYRLLVIVFMVMHGITHLLYPVAAWTSVRTGFGTHSWILPGDFTIHSTLGKLQSLIGVVVLALFLLATLGLLSGQAAWISPANLGIFASFAVVIPWVREAPRSIGRWQVFANLALMFLLAVPLSEEITLP